MSICVHECNFISCTDANMMKSCAYMYVCFLMRALPGGIMIFSTMIFFSTFWFSMWCVTVSRSEVLFPLLFGLAFFPRLRP